MEPLPAVAHLARSQYGLVALSQAVTLGVQARTVQRQVERQGAERIHRGVYALPGSVRSHERDLMAALLAAGKRSAISHESAAGFLGLHRSRARPLDVLVPMDRKAPELRGVRAHRSRTLKTADVARTTGIRHTVAARTLCDLAVVDQRRLRELVAVALQSRRTTIERIAATSQRLGAHDGVGRLRQVLDELRGTSSDSGFERRVREWLHDNGLPPHPCLYPVVAEDDVVVELDIAYPDEMVYVDCQGFPWHSLPASLRVDNIRGNGIAAAGWLALSLDEEQFGERPLPFLRQLRTVLTVRQGFAARWGARGGRRLLGSPAGW